MEVFAGDGGIGSGLSVVGGALMFGVVLVLLVTLVLLLAGTLIGWRVYRRVRRWRGWHRGAAAIQSRPLRPGPGRDIARLRRDLREEVEAADAALSRAKAGRLFVADAGALVGELKANAAAVDADLASVQDYADAAQQRTALDGLAPQVARLIQTSYLARHTVLQTEIADRERHLMDLTEDVERRAAALESYRRAASVLDLGHPHAHPATASDPQSRGQATDTRPLRRASSRSSGSGSATVG